MIFHHSPSFPISSDYEAFTLKYPKNGSLSRVKPWIFSCYAAISDETKLKSLEIGSFKPKQWVKGWEFSIKSSY